MDNKAAITEDLELKLFGALALFIVLFLGISLIFSFRANRRDVSAPGEVVADQFPQVSLEAKAAYVYDLRTGEVLFAKNEDKRLPLASLTKVMSALVARDISPDYGIVTVGEEALENDGDSGLFPDEKWALKDLLDFSLITSSNDGMRAVALALGALSRADATDDEIINDFVGRMNEKASDLGLKNTYFWNETGLDQSDIKGGAYGTAEDVTALMAFIIMEFPDLLAATQESVSEFASLDNNVHVARNTNDIISDIPGLLASKTGFTDTAGGNLSIIFDPELGRPIVVTVLGSTEEGRFSDVRSLVNSTLEYFNVN